MVPVGSTQPTTMSANKEKKNKDKINEKNNPNFISIENYCSEYAPGRRGGGYSLPKYGKLIIPDGAMTKKDSLVAGVVSPNNRYLVTPTVSTREILHSEIFIVDTFSKTLKHPVYLQIPYSEVDDRLYEINVRGLWSGEEEWVDVGFLTRKEEKEPFLCYAVLTLYQGGVFVVTQLPKKETFELTPNGSIFTSRLCRYFSLRCPRKAVDKVATATLEVIPFPPEKLLYCQENFSTKFSDLVDCCEMVEVICSHTDEYRRPFTIKMPIPSDIATQSSEADPTTAEMFDICVLHKEPEEAEWNLIESPKISRKMVAFDIKGLGRFCVIRVIKGRERRMKEALSILEQRYNKIPGCISMFVSFEEKLWTAVVACYAREDSEYFENLWKNRKFEKINPFVKKVPEKTTHFNIPGKRSEVYKFNDAEFFDGLSWGITIEGNFKMVESQKEQKSKLTYHSHMSEQFFMFHFQPIEGFPEKLVGNVTVTPDDIKDEEERSRLSGLFTLGASAEMADKYFYVEPEPEPEISKSPRPSLKRQPRVSITDDAKVKKEPVEKKTRKFSESADAMERLTKCVRRTIISREARVLSGRSLMVISQYVPNGLKLAVHLGLSESCITGLGFDALANGLQMSDITYKILLYWKRRVKNYDDAVQDLALAFKEMGLTHITNILINRHANGLEVTKDCFAFIEM